ncbi:MAG TPA: hypothetical protein VL326_14930 [Kofleriaceae bacterium]|nr:hypothetical protein [Kofleriaceae bacterium]
MRCACLAMVVLSLPSCWAGHDSCGVLPPQGPEWAGSGDEPAPADAAPRVEWTAGRIEQALQIDPVPVMRTLAHDNPLIVADTNAGTLTPVCRKAAQQAMDDFANELGPRNEPAACSEIAALHDTRTLVCIRPHDGRSFVALAFFRRGDDWDLTVLMKGDKPDPSVNQQILASLPDLACP